MTGFAVDYGTLGKEAIEMRLEESNYKVAGRPIKVIWEDSQTKPMVAVNKAKKLIERDKVVNLNKR